MGKPTWLNSLYTAMAIVVSCSPSLVIVPWMLSQMGFSADLSYVSCCFSMALATLIGVYIVGLPVVFGPQIGGVSYMLLHLHRNMGWSAEALWLCVVIAMLFFAIATILGLPKYVVKAFGPTLQRAVTGAIGVFFIALVMKTLPGSSAEGGFVVSDMSWLGRMTVLILLPAMLIEWLGRRAVASAPLWGMALSASFGYFLGMSAENPVTLQSPQVLQTFDYSLLQVVQGAGGWSLFFWGVLGLWLIQTLDVAGCSVGMLELAKARTNNDMEIQGLPAVTQQEKLSRLNFLAPVGTFFGLFSWPMGGISGPHCLYISSAVGICTKASHRFIWTGAMVAVAFLLLVVAKPWVIALPSYLSSCVLLWIGASMLRQLPWKWDVMWPDIVSGWAMVAAVAITGNLMEGFSVGIWMATALDLVVNRHVDRGRLVLSLLFLLSQLATR